MKSIYKKIGIIDISDEEILSYNLSRTIGYKIEGINYKYLSLEKKKNYVLFIQQLLNGLGEGISIQFITKNEKNKLDVFDRFAEKVPKNYKTNRMLEFMSDQLKKENIRKSTLHMFVTYDGNYKKRKRKWGFIFQGFSVENLKQIEKEGKEKIAEFNRYLTEKIRGTKLKTERLKTKELFNHIHQYLNEREGEYRHIYPDVFSPCFYKENGYMKNKTMREYLMQNPIENNKTHLKIKDKYFTTLVLDLLPIESNEEIIEDLQKINENISIQMAITVPKKQDMMKTLMWQKRAVIFGENKTLDETSIDRKNRFEEIKEVMEELGKKEQKLFIFRLNILVEGDTLEEVKRVANTVETKVNDISYMVITRADFNHIDNYFSFLPGQHYFNKKEHKILTKALSWFVPLRERFKGTKDTQIILKNNFNELIPISFKDNNLPSSHSLIFAPTGMGKSFTANYLLQRIIMNAKDTYITIIDKGGSYKKICSVFEGSYISVDLDKAYAVNIFPKKGDLIKEGKADIDQLIFMRDILLLMVGQEKYSAIEENLIRESIEEFYKGYERKETPILGEYVHHLEIKKREDEEDESFFKLVRKSLKLYVETYGMLFNQHKSVSLENEFLVFDITKMKQYPKLQQLYLFLISNVCSRRMANLDKQQFIIYDEVADLLKEKSSAGLIEEQYRTARKYGNYIWAISQSPDDFLGNGADAIRKNAEIKMVLQLEQDHKKLKEFGFNDEEIKEAEKLSLGEIFIKFGFNDSFISHIKPNKFEYELCSTDKESLLRYHGIEQTGKAFMKICEEIRMSK